MYSDWARMPVYLPRWALYVLYGLFTLLGAVLAIIGSPSIDLSTPKGYIEPYGIAISAVSLYSLVAAALPHRILPELIGAVLLFSLLTVFVVSTVGPTLQGDLTRAVGGILVLIASFLPLVRMAVLFRLLLARLAAQ